MKRIALLAAVAAAASSCKDAGAEKSVPGVAASHGYKTHGPKFEAAAHKLLAEGRCRPNDFKEFGGFWRSIDPNRTDQYFTYCGGMKPQNRIYIRVDSDKAAIVD